MLFQEVLRKGKRQSTNKRNNSTGDLEEPARKKTVTKKFNIPPIKAYNLNIEIVFKEISNQLKHKNCIIKKFLSR